MPRSLAKPELLPLARPPLAKTRMIELNLVKMIECVLQTLPRLQPLQPLHPLQRASTDTACFSRYSVLHPLKRASTNTACFSLTVTTQQLR